MQIDRPRSANSVVGRYVSKKTGLLATGIQARPAIASCTGGGENAAAGRAWDVAAQWILHALNAPTVGRRVPTSGEHDIRPRNDVAGQLRIDPEALVKLVDAGISRAAAGNSPAVTESRLSRDVDRVLVLSRAQRCPGYRYRRGVHNHPSNVARAADVRAGQCRVRWGPHRHHGIQRIIDLGVAGVDGVVRHLPVSP